MQGRTSASSETGKDAADRESVGRRASRAAIASSAIVGRLLGSRYGRVAVAACLGLTLVWLATPWLVGPPVPRHLIVASGSPEGAYFAFAHRYAEILAENDITLEVVSTNGSVDNLRRLQSGAGECQLAIVQGGIDADPESETRLESLASLYFEPVWLFHRNPQVTRLTDLRGGRIAVGSAGSGTSAIARTLLTENGLGGSTDPETTLLPLGSRDAATALLRGEIDAAFLVISPKANLIRELITADGIELLDFTRGRAYTQRYPFLSTITLSRGMLDLEADLPSRDIHLLAPAANLVATAELHPAVIPLLLDATTRVHADGGLLARPGTFPSAAHGHFPVNRDAARYLESGPTFLYRHLPFWVASGIDRTKLLLLPLCTLLLPFIKAAPPIYRWRIRSKIYRWYHVLRHIDQRLKEADQQADFSDDIRHLHELESELADVSVPLSYMEEFYNLRLHIAFVRGVLQKREERRRTDRTDQSRRAA